MTYQTASTKKPHSLAITKKRFLQENTPHAIILIAALIYCIFREPLLISVLGCVAIPLFTLWQITQTIPWFKKAGIKLTFWNISTVIIALTLVFGLFHQSANAFFLSGLEQFVNTLVEGAQTSAGGTIDTETVGLFFNFLRAIFLLGVVIAGLFAYGQAQQGNDWRPIATQIGLAFGLVIALDIITYIFTGTGGQN